MRASKKIGLPPTSRRDTGEISKKSIYYAGRITGAIRAQTDFALIINHCTSTLAFHILTFHPRRDQLRYQDRGALSARLFHPIALGGFARVVHLPLKRSLRRNCDYDCQFTS